MCWSHISARSSVFHPTLTTETYFLLNSELSFEVGGKLHLICVVLCAETCFPLSTLFTVSALSLLPCVHLSHPSDAHLHCPTSPVIMGRTMLTSRSLCNQLRRGAVLLFLATTQGHSSLHIYPESMCVTCAGKHIFMFTSHTITRKMARESNNDSVATKQGQVLLYSSEYASHIHTEENTYPRLEMVHWRISNNLTLCYATGSQLLTQLLCAPKTLQVEACIFSLRSCCFECAHRDEILWATSVFPPCSPRSADTENSLSPLLHTDRIENRGRGVELNPNINSELSPGLNPLFDCMSVFLCWIRCPLGHKNKINIIKIKCIKMNLIRRHSFLH